MDETNESFDGPEVRPEPEARPRWAWPRRALFRFVFVYFLLYFFPFPLSAIPWQYLPERVSKAADAAIFTPWSSLVDKAVTQWVGPKLVATPITIRPAGSGDTTWNHVQLVCFGVVALAAALIWSLADRWSKDHRRLHDWWRTYLRFALGSALISYGCFKVIPAQMPAPDLDRLAEPFGQASPMGLLWTFLGASSPYQILSGAAELLAGWLLVLRRTTTLGALLASGVMFNVAALNFCYDTPVKLYSMHLFATAFVLVLGDARRLLDLFVLHRALPANDLGRLFPWRAANVAAVLLGVLFFGSHTWSTLRVSWKQYQSFSNGPKPPIHGVWVTKSFELDGAPAVGDENEVWHRAVAGSTYFFGLETVGAPWTRYFSEYDVKSKALNLRRRGDPSWKARFTYDRPSDELLTLQGSMDGHEIYVEMRRIPESDYLLVTRGFHWINEYPNNQ